MSDEKQPESYCWHADDGPSGAFIMLAGADDGEVTLKIMGDTLRTTPAHAFAFAQQLLRASGLAAQQAIDKPPRGEGEAG